MLPSVRFMSGSSGISLSHCDDVVVENCQVHHCPGWTVGIYVNRVTGYVLRGNRVDYNSGSGIPTTPTGPTSRSVRSPANER